MTMAVKALSAATCPNMAPEPDVSRPDGLSRDLHETLMMFATLVEVTQLSDRDRIVTLANETGIDPGTLTAVLDADIDGVSLGALARLARFMQVRFSLRIG
ncbi:MAG: hypothetical protein N838_35650 [Thiohalocapsa sp. PB-PSB1]|jgi:hypothetical protein|nr:MAG: hypothetical protein N838_35650 [Thiohalocapsa sp. PB-PSB1]